jgi:hypothetical protein
MKRLLLVSTLLATLGAGSAYAQVFEDPTTLHIANDSSGGPGSGPNPITSNHVFFIDQQSNGNAATILSPVWVVLAVPNDSGVPDITMVTNKEGTANITWGSFVDLGDFSSGKLVTYLSTHTAPSPDASFTTDFNGVTGGFTNSIQFTTMVADEKNLALEDPAIIATGFEIYLAPINQQLLKGDWFKVAGDFPTGTFIVPFGFNANDSKGYTTSDTNFGMITSHITGAPEPSTWAMMAIGFAFLGYAGYRGRRSAVAAAI